MVAHLPALAAESARETALLMAEALPAKAGTAARLLRAAPGSCPLLCVACDAHDMVKYRVLQSGIQPTVHVFFTLAVCPFLTCGRHANPHSRPLAISLSLSLSISLSLSLSLSISPPLALSVAHSLSLFFSLFAFSRSQKRSSNTFGAWRASPLLEPHNLTKASNPKPYTLDPELWTLHPTP